LLRWTHGDGKTKIGKIIAKIEKQQRGLDGILAALREIDGAFEARDHRPSRRPDAFKFLNDPHGVHGQVRPHSEFPGQLDYTI
jgi:hypothetical protein